VVIDDNHDRTPTGWRIAAASTARGDEGLRHRVATATSTHAVAGKAGAVDGVGAVGRFAVVATDVVAAGVVDAGVLAAGVVDAGVLAAGVVDAATAVGVCVGASDGAGVPEASAETSTTVRGDLPAGGLPVAALLNDAPEGFAPVGASVAAEHAPARADEIAITNAVTAADRRPIRICSLCPVASERTRTIRA